MSDIIRSPDEMQEFLLHDLVTVIIFSDPSYPSIFSCYDHGFMSEEHIHSYIIRSLSLRRREE
jgi:hypothetical protein